MTPTVKAIKQLSQTLTLAELNELITHLRLAAKDTKEGKERERKVKEKAKQLTNYKIFK